VDIELNQASKINSSQIPTSELLGIQQKIQTMFDPSLAELGLCRSNYKKLLNQVAPVLISLFDRELETTGEVKVQAIVSFSDELGLPVKTICQFLECLGKIPLGNWERSPVTPEQINEVKQMSWKNGMGLATANKLFDKYGITIAQDPKTKIYTATLGDRTIQHTSVTGIAETILEKWFALVEPGRAIGAVVPPKQVTPADFALR
jgi:hypothetical protein